MTHSQPFFDPDGFSIDLHWHVLVEGLWSDADRDFWSTAQPLAIRGLNVLTLEPTNMLFHLCSHAVVHTSIQWVVDIPTVLRVADDRIDWNRLIVLARRFRQVLSLKTTLGYLKNVFYAPIPDSFFRDLALTEVDPFERRYLQIWLPTPKNNIYRAVRNWWRFRFVFGQGQSLWSSIVRFPEYLRILWDLSSTWEIFPHGLVLLTRNFNRDPTTPDTKPR
jgi:hypothetical protein